MNFTLSDVCVIIPQHNQVAWTFACVSSLKQFHPDVSIVVVDDGSHDRNRQITDRFLSPICNVLYQNHQGITAAWNLGIGSCQQSVIVLLNNDVITYKPWLTDAMALLEQHPSTLVGARTRTEPYISDLFSGEANSLMLEGWCLGFHRDVFHAVGQFDESMRLYFSDTDFQLRHQQCFPNEIGHFRTLPAGVMHHARHQSCRQIENRSQVWRNDRDAFVSKWKSLITVDNDHEATSSL